MCFLLGILALTMLPSKCVCVCVCVCAQSCLTLCDPWTVAHQAPLSMDFPGRNTGVRCHFLLQGILPTQRANCVSFVSCIGMWILYHRVTWEASVPYSSQHFSGTALWSKLPSSPWPTCRSSNMRSPWAVTSLCPLLEKTFVGHVYGSWLSPSQRGRA